MRNRLDEENYKKRETMKTNNQIHKSEITRYIATRDSVVELYNNLLKVARDMTAEMKEDFCPAEVHIQVSVGEHKSELTRYIGENDSALNIFKNVLRAARDDTSESENCIFPEEIQLGVRVTLV